MTVVIDTNVFVSAAISRTGTSWQCFLMLARRQFILAVTKEILMEYETVAERTAQRLEERKIKWRSLFDWVRDRSRYFEPMPLGRQRSRDLDDDIFLACALAAGAKIIVSRDKDLLDLEKPFGIEIITPVVFVARFK